MQFKKLIQTALPLVATIEKLKFGNV